MGPSTLLFRPTSKIVRSWGEEAVKRGQDCDQPVDATLIVVE